MSHFGWLLRLGEYRFHLFIYLFILRKLDLLRLLTEGGIEFQLDTLILVKDVFLSSIILEYLTGKHCFADNRG